MKFIFFAVIFFAINTHAQNINGYVCFSTGLNMRDKPSLQGKVIGKVPYATKLIYDENKKDTNSIVVENMNGYWVPVTYQNKKGYVLDCYLISIPPPKKGTISLEAYLKQITTVAAPLIKMAKGNNKEFYENSYEKTIQVYKNTASWHSLIANEYAADAYFLPNLNTKEAFLILRQIKDFEDIITEKDALPIKSEIKKDASGNDKEIKVTIENLGFDKWVQRIEIKAQNGPYEVFILESLGTGEVMISRSIGV